MKFTTLPVLLAMVLAIANMPTDIYQVCAWNHGTVKTEPWRSKLATVPAIRTVIAFASRVREWYAELAAVPLLASEIGAVGKINQLIQEEAENKAAIRKLKKEGRDLNAVEKPTEDQAKRLTAVFAELDTLEAKQETIEADLVKARRLQDDERGTAATVVHMGHNNAADKPWGPTLHADATPAMKAEAQKAALGEFAIAVKNSMSGTGTDPRLFAAATGMGTAVPSDGGFAVPSEVAAGIERDLFAGGELLSRVDARTISGDAIAYNVVDETSRASTRNGGVLGYWVDQGTAATASQPKLARIEMKLRKVGALGYMTDELVADAAGLGGELQSMFTDELIFQVEDAIFEGTGQQQPLGFTNTACPCLVSVAKESGQSAATINTTNLSKMWARLPARSQANAVWLVNVDTQPQLDFLSIPAAAGALEPRFVNYGPDGILRIKGRQVIPVEYAASLGTVNDICLVDLSKYRLIRKGGVEQASSIHVRFTQGEQTFRAFYRCDGQPVPRSALTPFKGSNTLSPFVVLATRA
jgi:HK97 family phage major capsid protein